MRVRQTSNPEAPWFVRWQFEYDANMVRKLGRIPGCKWIKEGRYWLVPIEVAEQMLKGPETC